MQDIEEHTPLLSLYQQATILPLHSWLDIRYPQFVHSAFSEPEVTRRTRPPEATWTRTRILQPSPESTADTMIPQWQCIYIQEFRVWISSLKLHSASLKTEFNKCFYNQVKAGNSGRWLHRNQRKASLTWVKTRSKRKR